MKKLLLIFTLWTTFLSAGTINIAVAANVSYAIDELIAEFNKTHKDTKVRVTLGSSGKLTAQIKHGAPYHLFMAANMMFPQSLYNDKIAKNAPVIYALGSLAILSKDPKDMSKGIDLLKSDEIYKIAIANPKTAPYGTAAMQAFESAGIYKDIKSKLIFAESISQTVSFAITAADIGLIAKSSLYSKTMLKYKQNINWIEVDPSLYTPIKQGIVMIEEDEETKAFYEFILSDNAKEIFKKYGYLLP
ncbi:MAG: molybdate ABC transporter substrate-binding protein [Sulfurimonas sp.]|uniref:molybdate ABC transporter substrate-binding protein n=1 Tax=Sulfurimonas sp. TaxID=2022749 RepID=UPI0025D384D5|nr:molybdate ABC transporter substrate-binding protein [Sulfurimonas sp.]MCK9490568.1 molybdate ABC transporter substrate-binding protein [Sulfurimonas sp.]